MRNSPKKPRYAIIAIETNGDGSLFWKSSCSQLLCLNRTADQVVLEHEGNGDENEIEQKHGEAESLVHLPPEAGDGHDDEQQHHEEDRYGADHAHRVHLHGLPVYDSV